MMTLDQKLEGRAPSVADPLDEVSIFGIRGDVFD
jgi:hypothetical protein